jgi:type II restriction enzyme
LLVGIQDEILWLHSKGLLKLLLADKTTKSNIIWATDAYEAQGAEYRRDAEITEKLITSEHSDLIKTRARKAMEQQSERTRKHAEVFTPLWVCQKMCSHGDEVWFGTADPFFTDGQPTSHVSFPKKKKWQHYVDARRLEITCGEAPYLVSRYDVSTGEQIPLDERTGILDRKLRVVNENAADQAEWLKWALRAVQATYGYEFQGDNLLIARVNLLMTYEEYLQERWKRKPTTAEYRKIAHTIAWNLWQMDGLTGTIPYCKEENPNQLSLFEEPEEAQEDKPNQPRCRIFDWRGAHSLDYLNVNQGGRNMKFDFVIGNPPYQDETIGENKTYAPPIYHMFLDAAYQVSDKVEMIHPARFLFDAGSTPKAWNQKMLSDPHFSVLYYTANSSEVFSNTDIKGGIAISYYDKTQDFGAIGHFIVFDELRSILKKVSRHSEESLSSIIYASESYKFSKQMHEEHPEVWDLLSTGHKYDFKTSVLENLDNIIFFDDRPDDGNEYVQIVGLVKGKRTTKWIKREYIKEPENFTSYKIFVPAANGSGALGEVLSTPVIGQPVIGHTQTFISVGNFSSEYAADACIRYIKTKFCRTMLGILKITQHNPAPKWKYVPLQDFTPASDIDWSKSIPEIDRQLYAKYGLDETEITFIETHVKEMA